MEKNLVPVRNSVKVFRKKESGETYYRTLRVKSLKLLERLL
jgi:hypothetical protein